MNATISVLPSLHRKMAVPRHSDHEFLPAALEILETPPSPVRVALLFLLCTFISIAIGWSAWGQVDIVASASGKVVPVEQVRAIQSAQDGNIATITKVDGDHVEAGDILAILDDSQARAQLGEQEAALASSEAEIIRRRAVASVVETVSFEQFDSTNLSIDWPPTVTNDLARREEAVAQTDLHQLLATLGSVKAQLAEQEASIVGLQSAQDEQRDLVDTLEQRSTMRQSLEERQAGSKAERLEALGELQTQRVALANGEASIRTASAHLDVLRREYAKTLSAFANENQHRLLDTMQARDALRQRVAQLAVTANQAVIRSPIAGIVAASSLKSIGQVVASGQELMRVVPKEGGLQVHAYLPNTSMGFIHTGQLVELKVDAFPFTQYGTLKGKVRGIATDAVGRH